MTGEPGAKGAPHLSTDERAQGQDVLGLGERERRAMLAWVSENLALVHQSASGQGLLYRSLEIGFVVGLAAHIGGYLLRTSAPKEPFGLLADLLYALGWSLWTGAIVVMFVQVIPEAKATSIEPDARCLRGGGRQSGPSRKWPGPGPGEREGRITSAP